MLHRLHERFNRLRAEALPARLAYWAAKRILAHAALTKYSERATSDIGAIEALEHWEASMLPQRVGRGLARLRVNHPTSAPLFQDCGDTIRPRDVQPPEMLEEVEIEELKAVRVVAEVKPGARA